MCCLTADRRKTFSELCGVRQVGELSKESIEKWREGLKSTRKHVSMQIVAFLFACQTLKRTMGRKLKGKRRENEAKERK